jgi:hypothetical protein
MECRIEVGAEVGSRTVRVAGRLTDAHVPDLASVCGELPGPVEIDLAELVSADRVGLEALRRLRTSGARIVNAPRFIELMLSTSSPDRNG